MRKAPQPVDFSDALTRLRDLPKHQDVRLRSLFEVDTPIHVARAPGRLDVMGGFGDYSGSLVLQLPIAEAAFAAVQQSTDDGVVVASIGEGLGGSARISTMTKDKWKALQRAEYDTARQILHKDSNQDWAAYVIGPLLVLLRETAAQCDGGLRILIDSSVPEGKGVSSSASVEVATMRAAAALLGVVLSGERLALVCQQAENLVVGAPCGIMDQMTSALGRKNELLALRCQPAVVEGYVPIPSEVAFWGIDSGIRHAVSGSDYTSVRCGTFMGYRMIADAAGLKVTPASEKPDAAEIDDPSWHGYLANITPTIFRARFESRVPEQISGAEFLARFGGTTDRITRVDPSRTYAIRKPTLHPIEENQRVGLFRQLLLGDINDDSLREMGQLMAQAHESYSACGLGSDGTDLLVRLVHDVGSKNGLYGAKITGGGSGGTIAILGRADAAEAVEAVAHQYENITGRSAYIFRGSSPGACATGVQSISL